MAAKRRCTDPLVVDLSPVISIAHVRASQARQTSSHVEGLGLRLESRAEEDRVQHGREYVCVADVHCACLAAYYTVVRIERACMTFQSPAPALSSEGLLSD